VGCGVSTGLPQKIIAQIAKAGLPIEGDHPFKPKLMMTRHGDQVIEKKAVAAGPKKGKRGFVDEQGRIWVKDRAHGGLPDHWDVQMDNGRSYFRVDLSGTEIL
jgi:hypothetical protein